MANADSDADGDWLTDLSHLCAAGQRDAAIALYRGEMVADEKEAASFVDDLIANPVTDS
jgi:hypothetical protein